MSYREHKWAVMARMQHGETSTSQGLRQAIRICDSAHESE